ncbi:MAG: hypothetical protein BroJett011_62240 [Chloroflexota bacterium]|nr:MAG: hypothetical protein BroJett011_62240 [Chloroflexota bacterium]
MTTTSTPMRCPFCNAQGINYLEAKTVGFFAVIYCAKCGAIHGVVPAQPQPAKAEPKPAATPQPEPPPPPQPEPFDLRKIDVEETPPKEPKPEPTLTPARAQAMMAHYVQPGSTMYRIIRKDDEET